MAQTLTTFRGKSPSWNKPCTTSSHSWPGFSLTLFLASHTPTFHCPFLDTVISSFAPDNEGPVRDRARQTHQKVTNQPGLSLVITAPLCSATRQEETAQNSYPDLLSKLPDDHHFLYYYKIVYSKAKVSKVVPGG